jgi:hypothetical protein
MKRTRQRRHVAHDPVGADQRAAALVGIRFNTVPPDGVRNAGHQLQ